MRIDLEQLEFIDKNLRIIALEIEEQFGEKVITSLYRIDDSGVHGQLPLRGIDLRCRTGAHGIEVSNYVNDRWVYDSSRPKKLCAMCHNVGKGQHIHLQTHFNTRRRNDRDLPYAIVRSH